MLYRINKEKFIYSAHGSFIIFTKKFFLNYVFYYEAFLFGEEIYLAEVCKKSGYKIIYFPEIKFLHKEHSTTGRWKKGKMLRYKKESIEFLQKILSDK